MPDKPGKQSRPQKNELFHLSEDIIANIGVGIYLVQGGVFVYVSPLFLKLTGYSETDLLGQSPLEHVRPDDREMVKKRAVNGLKGKNREPYEYRFIRKDDTQLWVLELVTSFTYNGQRAALGCFIDITERKQTEETLRESEEKYRTILEEIDEAYYEVDLSGNFTFVNDSVCRRLGYSREELMGMNYRVYTPEEQLEDVYKTYLKVFQTGETLKWYPFQNIRKNGTMLHIEASISPLRNKEGHITGFRGITNDITERMRMEEIIRQSEERYRTIIDEMEEWYFETDLSGNLLFINDAFVRALGYSEREMIGMNFRAFVKAEEAEVIYRIFHQIYETGEPTKDFPHEFDLPDGKVKIAEFSIFPKRDHQGQVSGFRGVGHDITERKRIEQQLEHLATHDPLTALPNRMLFTDRLKMALSRAKRNKMKLAVLMLDLDRFKNINDTLGHAVGDQLLITIGRRLTNLLRQTDTIARLGGDEFIILLPETIQKEDPSEVAQKILEDFQHPFTFSGYTLHITVSIGVAVYPVDAQGINSLLKNADIAMYQAKAHGRNNYQIFTDPNQNRPDKGQADSPAF